MRYKFYRLWVRNPASDCSKLAVDCKNGNDVRVTAVTVSELLRENQQGSAGGGGKIIPLPNQISVKSS